MTTSILASIGRMLWRYLEANSIDGDALFNRHELDPSLIHEPRTRYALRQLCTAFVEASSITGNENIGLELAKHYHPLDLNALGVAFLSSETLIEALQRLVRYESAVNSNLTFTITESNNAIRLSCAVLDVPDSAVHILEDVRTSVIVDLCRLGLEKSLDPVEVSFTYPEPKSTGLHFGIFRCPVKFSQPAPEISFDIQTARRAFTAANRELAISGDRIIESMIDDLKSSDTISQIKKAIINHLPSGTPSEEQIAQQVFVSSRTLQRRLADEGTNFRTLVLEVRRQLAEKYIADKTMPLAEISYMLGFSDTSSFSRAFKQWTGDSPATFRNNIFA